MNEKQPASPDNSKKLEDNKKYYIALGGAAAVLALTEIGIGIQYSREMPDPSAGKVTETLIRHNKYVFSTLLQQERCPPLSDPADITKLTESVILSSETTSEQIASQYSLEVIDQQHYDDLAPLLTDATSSSEITNVVNDFAQKYMDIKVHADTIHENTAIDVDHYRLQMWRFTNQMKNIPTTLLDKLGIKDIVVRPGDNDKSNGIAEYDPAIRTVEIDLEQLDSPGTILHEIVGHGVHAAICDDTNMRDQMFASYNPAQHQYKEDDWRGRQYDDDDYTSSYATKNVLEDYAQTTQDYFTGKIIPNVKDPKTPLDNKVTMILDRLNIIAPGSAEYLTSKISNFSAFEQGHQNRLEQMQKKR